MKKPAAVGIDVGGTKTLCVLVDQRFRLLQKVKFKTEAAKGRARFTRKLTQSVRSLVNAAQSANLKIVAVGIGCAGLVDEKKVRVRHAPNLLWLDNYPIGKHLKRLVHAKFAIGNDVQLGTYAEHRLGAAKGHAHVLGVFMGTSIAGAVIIDDKLYAGASGVGGQVGSLLVQHAGGAEVATTHGILDRVAGKSAIASDALVMAMKNWAPHLRKRVGTDLSKVSWSELRRAVRDGDRRIKKMLHARMRVVGATLANVVNFLNPDVVVFGGGLIGEMPELLREIESGLREYLIPETNRNLRIKLARLGEASVAIGAAHLAWRTSA
jgi:glucokinase